MRVQTGVCSHFSSGNSFDTFFTSASEDSCLQVAHADCLSNCKGVTAVSVGFCTAIKAIPFLMLSLKELVIQQANAE